MKSNEDTDEQLTRYVEESEEAFSLLSSNFDILRDDNERLQVEIDRLRCMSDDRSLEDKSTDSEQLQAFERALMTEITCVRDQLRLKEAKVKESCGGEEGGCTKRTRTLFTKKSAGEK